jgi:hypothetical protein
VIRRRHRAVDRNHQRHGITGFGKLGESQPHATWAWLTVTDVPADGLLHCIWRAPEFSGPQSQQATGGTKLA